MIQISRLRHGLLRAKSDPLRLDANTNWPIVFLVWAAGLGAAAQFGKIAIALDAFRGVYAVSEVQLGFLISCVGIVGLIFGVVGGILIPRIGIRRAFVWGMFSAAALSAAQSLEIPFTALILLRILEGASHLSIVVAGPILMARHSSNATRPAVMTLWSSFFGLSYMLIALIAPTILIWAGLQGLFLAHAGYMFVLGVLLWLILPAANSAPSNSGTDLQLNLSNIFTLHSTIYRSPWISAAALGFVCYTGLYMALLTYLPSFVDETQRVGLSASLPLASIVTSLTIGILLLRYVTPVNAVILGFLLTLLSAIPLFFTYGNDAVFIAACLLLMGATGIIPGASFAALADLNTNDNERAYATGALAQLGNVGTTCGPPLLAGIILATDIAGVVIFVILLCVAGVFIHMWQRQRRLHHIPQRD